MSNQNGNGTARFNLDQLADKVAGQVELFGRSYDVLQITGGQYQDQSQFEPGDNRLLRMIERVGEVCPTMPDELRRSLNIDQLSAIMGISIAGVDYVQRTYAPDPHAGPARESTSSESGPETLPLTSSSPSADPSEISEARSASRSP